jgi:hypothetical protein
MKDYDEILWVSPDGSLGKGDVRGGGEIQPFIDRHHMEWR